MNCDIIRCEGCNVTLIMITCLKQLNIKVTSLFTIITSSICPNCGSTSLSSSSVTTTQRLLYSIPWTFGTFGPTIANANSLRKSYAVAHIHAVTQTQSHTTHTIPPHSHTSAHTTQSHTHTNTHTIPPTVTVTHTAHTVTHTCTHSHTHTHTHARTHTHTCTHTTPLTTHEQHQQHTHL